jgi:hypothetical protein
LRTDRRHGKKHQKQQDNEIDGKIFFHHSSLAVFCRLSISHHLFVMQ